MMYILDGHTPKKIDDILEAARWLETADRTVRKTEVGKLKEILVSTVFLGIDHSFGRGAPVLFETMIFGGEHDEDQERYHTWEETEEGHERAAALARGLMNQARIH